MSSAYQKAAKLQRGAQALQDRFAADAEDVRRRMDAEEAERKAAQAELEADPVYQQIVAKREAREKAARDKREQLEREQLELIRDQLKAPARGQYLQDGGTEQEFEEAWPRIRQQMIEERAAASATRRGPSSFFPFPGI